MSLKAVVGSLDEVPEPLRPHYAEDGDSGQFVLQAEGVAPPAKLKEFRSRNIELTKRIEELEGKLKGFGDVTPEALGKLRDDLAQLQEKAKLADGDFDGAVEQRVKRLRDEYQKQAEARERHLGELSRERDEIIARLNRAELERQIRAVAARVSIFDSAADDVLLRAARVFRVEEDRLVARDDRGEQIYDQRGDPLTPDTWIRDLAVTAPHLFKSSAGGGASGGAAGGRGPLTITKEQARTPSPELLEQIASGKVTVVG